MQTNANGQNKIEFFLLSLSFTSETHIKKPMPKPKKGISVRFTPDELSRLETLANRYNVPMTTIIRWSIQALDDYTANSNGRLTLPVDFRNLLRDQRASVVNEPGPDYSACPRDSNS